MVDETRIPQEGERLTSGDVEMILEAVKTRQENFEEPASLSMLLVLLNIGNRFAPVTCINGEWEGIKRDIPRGEGVPKCPNGHVMTEGPGLALGWVKDE